MQKLPIELLKGIDSPSASIREIIAEELAQILHSTDVASSTVAYGALQKLCEDDSRKVSKIATESIAAYEEKKAALFLKAKPKKPLNTASISPKQKYSTTALRIYGLVGLVAILFGTSFYFLSPSIHKDEANLVDPAQPVALAMQEMLELKSSAQELGAEVYALETYKKAIEAEERGKQKSLEGDHLSAKISYDFAKGLFNQSLEETLENVRDKSPNKEEDNLLEISALGAKSDMESAQSEAKKERADKVVKASYKRAVEVAEKAEQAYAEGEFFVAASEYDAARDLFTKAGNEAKRKKIATETNLNNIKKIVTAARKEMLRERENAEKGGGKEKVKELFRQAELKKEAGDSKFKVANKKSYLAAQNYFTDAKEVYKQVNRELDNSFFIPKFADEASLARTKMASAKDNISASEPEKSALDTYQKATKLEKKGEADFAAKKYEVSQVSFQQAESLYIQAQSQLIASKTKPTDTGEGITSGSIEKETDSQKLAQQEIQNLIRAYKSGLENKDLNQLTPFISASEQKTWANFFDTVKDMKVSIQNENIQIDQDEAQANFKVVMSYFNKTTNKTITNSIPKDWKLANVDSKWGLYNK